MHFFTLLLMTFVLFSCGRAVSDEEAQAISVKVACPYFEEVGKKCEGIEPNEYSTQKNNIKMYTFFLKENPEYTIVVLVHRSGNYEVSILDKR